MRRAIVPVCLLALLAPAAVAGQHEFELKSRLLMQDPAISEAMDQIKAEPGNAAAWQDLGKALAAKGAYEDAEAALERASEIDPKNPDLWVDLGAVRVRDEKYGAGVDALRRAIKIEPFHALARYDLGLALQALGGYDEALDSFEDALLLDPSLGDPRKNPGAANNPDLEYVKLRVYMRTAGAAPALMTP